MDIFRRSSTPISSPSGSTWGQPLDRAALLVMVMLSVAIAALLVLGDRTAPRIRDFSWQDKQIGAEDTAFTLTFSRPMNHQSVEDNLTLEAIVPGADPQVIPGKFSWAGQRMAYTLEQPAPYGYEFQLTLENARDKFSEERKAGATIEPFTANFRTRDRAFLYLGIEGDEEGRLILYNLTQQEKRVLTPPDLVVLDYESYPRGDRVVFSATARNSSRQGVVNQKLYTVATGIELEDSPPSLLGNLNRSTNAIATDLPREGLTPREPTLLLDSDEYKNLQFDLSPDGQTIVIYRVNRQRPDEFGLWVLRPEQPPQPLETEPGGRFLITPDSQSLAYLQGAGLAILPLAPENGDAAVEPLDFLPQYGMVLSFSLDGSKAAMVEFKGEANRPLRSLFLVTNRGEEKELLVTSGSILDAQFDPTGEFLYCLATELQSTDFYLEQPYLSAINVNTGEQTNLLLLPQQQNIQMSIAPDGLGILFDQVTSSSDPTTETLLRGNDGSSIVDSQLWFFPLSHDDQGRVIAAEPDSIPVAGLYPKWVP